MTGKPNYTAWGLYAAGSLMLAGAAYLGLGGAAAGLTALGGSFITAAATLGYAKMPARTP
jgi:hypothetical protein